MFDDLTEFRYPFSNAIEFASGGYGLQPEALHLSLGWIFLVCWTIRTLLQRGMASQSKLSLLYFAFTVFTNPAYDIAGLKVNEIFGVLAAAWFVLQQASARSTQKRWEFVPITLAIAFVVCALHNVAASLLYPEINNADGAPLTRVAVTAKIIVLAINLQIISNSLRTERSVHLIIRNLVSVGCFALLMYLLQIALLATGTLPFGTFLDAGFIGFPSFASVSIERGHFGKFMAPLFPFFLYAAAAYRWRLQACLLVLVTMINISASSQAFFACFCLLAVFHFRRRLQNFSALLAAGAGFLTIGALVTYFWPLFEALIDKISTLALQGDESQGGGRSFGLFVDYLDAFPFGIGYSGSSLRIAPGLPEINAGFYAFITQLSVLAPPLILGFLVLAWKTYNIGIRRLDDRLLGTCLGIAVLTSLLIFYADILWFTPTIWLAYEMIWSLRLPKRVLAIAPQGLGQAA